MIRGMTRSLRLATTRLSVSASALLLVSASAFSQPVRAPTNASRPALEQEFRERVAKLAQQRIGLTDAQMTQLGQSNARFGPQLNQIAAQERDTRQQLRAEMTSPTPNQQHVNALLDQSLQLQKQRIAVVEQEQKDLARFMTPVQRARYIALQQQFRRRAQELARQDRNQRNMGFKDSRRGLKKIR
jgi:periplasmic protein CpxP/Spy